eukprot:8778729-Lingulodinium_polyedra.AAC.1
MRCPIHAAVSVALRCLPFRFVVFALLCPPRRLFSSPRDRSFASSFIRCVVLSVASPRHVAMAFPRRRPMA